MPNLRPVPIGENPYSSWQNLIQKTVQAQNVIAGSNVSVSGNGDYTKVSVSEGFDPNKLIWRGNFDVEAEYRVNDVIRVLADVEYIDVTTGDPLEIGSDANADPPPLCLGTFVCVQYVPPSFADEDYFIEQVVPVYGTVIPYEIQTGIRWNDYNVYYPICPEIPSSMTSSIDPIGYGFTITANDTFWQRMSSGDGGSACQCRYH